MMFKSKKIPATQLVDIYKYLADLLEAKVDAAEACECIARDAETARVRNALQQMADAIRQGGKPNEELAERSAALGKATIRLLRLADDRNIVSILRTLESRHEKNAVIRHVWRDLRWTLLVHAAFLLFICMIAFIFVLPTMADMFASFGADLPTITRLVLNAGDFVSANAYIGILIIALYLLRRRIPYMNSLFSRLGLVLPVSRGLMRMVAGSQFMNALTTLRAAGLPLQLSLQAATDSVENALIRKSYATIAADVEAGKSLPGVLRAIDVVPRRLVQTLEVAECSGGLEKGLEAAIESYEERLVTRIVTLQGRFRFFAIFGIGIVVLILALAFYLPIFRLTSVV